ncbi:MAG: AbrB family transcriptional regulator [Negativicutes bacterium]|nr:AbrB family transcriptional regulator [Negativicutes bacterium]
MLKNYLAIFLLSCAGGWFFSLVHMPLPWTLGPLVTVIVVQIGFQRPVYWPAKIRNLAMVFLGYVMGSPFTPQTGQHVLAQFPAMAVITLLTVALCLGGGYVTGRYLDMGLATSMLGSMPGGLTQMAMVCEEVEGSDAAAVTLMQTVRVLTTVFIVPFLVLHGLADRVDPVSRVAAPFQAGDMSGLLLFAAVIMFLLGLMRYFRVPNPYLIAPIVGTAGLVLSGVHPPAMPAAVVALAQVCVGIRMGMAVEVSSLANWKKVLAMNFVSVFLVIVAFFGIDYLMARLAGISFVTAFISTAPGGMAEMGLTALMVHADLSTVIAFQLFRLMFVLLIAIPLVRWWLCRSPRNGPCCRSEE